MLRSTALTDLDLQAAVAFERYGSEEIRRRARQRNERDTVLSAKRKRSARGTTVAGLSDAHLLLDFWHAALRCEDCPVLHTLAAHRKSTVRDASLSTLVRQAEGSGVADNSVMQRMSVANAMKSAQALATFVGRRAHEPVGICVLQDGRGPACGFQRVDAEGANTAVHACVLPPHSLRPPGTTGVALAWSRAVKRLAPRSESSATLPGIFERLQEMQRMKVEAGKLHGRAAREAVSMETFVREESCASTETAASGTTRSFVSVDAFLCTNASHETAARNLVEETRTLRSRARDAATEAACRYPRLLHVEKDGPRRTEPVPTPSSPVALGIGANEALRRFMAGRTRKNDPCIKYLGHGSVADMNKDLPSVIASEPLPLLTMTDLEMERVGETKTFEAHPKVGCARVAMAIHVCGDSATRVVDLIDAMHRANPSDARRFTLEARAAILAASSQASFIGGSLSGTISCGYINAAVASSKKIAVCDNNKLFLLSAYDSYVVGNNNVQPCFAGTAYHGTYGCRIDTGFTPAAIGGFNYKSDRRQHGNCCLSQETANAMLEKFAQSHWVVYDRPTKADVNRKRKRGQEDGSCFFVPAPVSTRGIPHNFIPGIHSMTRDYCAFLEASRKLQRQEDADVVTSVQVLPFSPFSQALRPDLECSSDSSLRTCFRDEMEVSVASGRAHLVDSTAEEMAIVREPLFRRPQQVSTGDCPFATLYENVDSFFNVCNALALVARSCFRARGGTPCASGTETAEGARCVAHLHAVIDAFLDADGAEGGVTAAEASWAADALTLINTLYPSNTLVAELVVAPGVAKLVPLCQKLLKKRTATEARVRAADLLAPEDLDAVREWWARFRREPPRCAWSAGLAPLLALIVDHDGSHKVDVEVASRFRQGLENAVRAVWLVHSTDGVSRPDDASPLCDASDLAHVSRHHLDPVFVGNSELGVKQRGGVVGCKPHSLRQVYALMMGAFIKDVSQVNVAVNEGGLSLRISSDPTIIDGSKGRARTEKSISPVQTEGDEMAYGSRVDKVKGAVLQKKAWDVNAMLSLGLFTAVDPPRPEAVRGRGLFGNGRLSQREATELQEEQQLAPAAFAASERLLREAACSGVAERVNLGLCV